MWRWLLVLGAIGCASQRGALREARLRDTIAWSTPVQIATGGGERGPWRQNESRFDYVDDPSVVIGADGAATVVWVDQQRKDVLLQIFHRDGRARLAEPVNVSRTADVFSWLPRVVLSPDDSSRIYVVWQEIVFSGDSHGGDILFARSLDGGRSFERAQNLSRSIHGDGKGRITKSRWHNGSFDLAVDDDTLYVAWTAYEGPLWLRRSRDGGASFDPAIVVDAGTQAPARAPSVAVGGGTLYLAWTVGEDDRADIRVATSRDGETFGEPVIVERTAGYSDAPKLAVDARGRLHVAYSETTRGSLDRSDVRYTRSRDGVTFETARVISHPHPRGVVGADFPSLAIDGERVLVTWEQLRHANALPQGLGIAYSLDAGATFKAPESVAGTHDRGANGSQQGRLMRKLALRGREIVIVNSALREGESSRVWLVRGAIGDSAGRDVVGR